MDLQFSNDFRKEFWFHVADQNEIPIYGTATKSIDSALLHDLAGKMTGTENDINTLKDIILHNPDAFDTLRAIVGVSDKRMYLELSYLFNKYRQDKHSASNILGESVYSLKKHSVNYFKKLIKKNDELGKKILGATAGYLENKGVIKMLLLLKKMSEREISSLVENLLLPKEIQQEETKRRGHGAEQALARLLHSLGVTFIPDKRHLNPMSQDDPNVDKATFELSPRDEKKTWSMDLIISQNGQLRVFVEGLIHSSDPGQYGVNKSAETVEVKASLDKHNAAAQEKKELWGLVDGVGFIENPENTVFKMIKEFDTFVQLKSLYKAGLKLHRLGLVKIKAIRFDMTFYNEAEALEMFAQYGAEDIVCLTDDSPADGKEIPAGKAWLYV